MGAGQRQGGRISATAGTRPAVLGAWIELVLSDEGAVVRAVLGDVSGVAIAGLAGDGLVAEAMLGHLDQVVSATLAQHDVVQRAFLADRSHVVATVLFDIAAVSPTIAD